MALNPIIKFTTLFGLLAMEIAISNGFRTLAPWFGIAFIVVGAVFKGVARRNRAADEANGIDYGDSRYGK